MSIPLRNANDPAAEQNPVRNGNRWHVTAINAEDNRLAARRLDDNTVAVLDSDYLREHITHGYAVTVHSAQGVTADTTHAVLGENTTRGKLDVAMTRGREINNAYIYERATEQEYGQFARRACHGPPKQRSRGSPAACHHRQPRPAGNRV
jgi:ATP-dependent exoDNAse (exonuclease V) alpha subunit